jgi:UPF0755 protein
MRRLLGAGLAGLVALAAWSAWFCLRPLEPPGVPFDFSVKSGASLRSVSHQLSAAGLLPEPYTFWLLGRFAGKASQIQAGTYRLTGPLTPLELLDKLARGDVLPIAVVFVEGTTFRQWLAQMRQNPQLRVTLAGEPQFRAALGVTEPSLEGLLFPETYHVHAGTTDVELLRRAYAEMSRRLARAWETRDPTVPLKSPYEALILASIVEKETGQPGERATVASVFLNRLAKGMRLQTDPTVIYGLGERYDGRLRKRDLLADSPWNTYTRDGLPPTPIAMPGAASIAAVLNPARTDYLYFVSKGDGTHQFSRTLEEHNRAVAKYQLGKS